LPYAVLNPCGLRCVPCGGGRRKAMIAIVDYGAGNLRSVANALSRVGCAPKVTSEPREVLEAGAVVFPGVGAAPVAMRNLERKGLGDAVRRLIEEDRPLFAVCIGMQVLFSVTEEGGGHECLGVLSGQVRRLPSGLVVPHMGWNQVRQQVVHPVFEGVPDGADFYFVHSFCCYPEDDSVVAGTTEYGVRFCSMAIRGNLIATQFHPEKSGEHGLRLYSNFLGMAGVR